MDKLVRKITDKTTGAPITDADVVARPVSASGSEADISMPETPPGSGIYASTAQVDHDTYKIIVNSNDSLDEFTVEAGRVEQTLSDSSVSYPLIDRIVGAKLGLAALIDDKALVVTPAQFRSALTAASFSDSVQRELVLDRDVRLEASVALTGDLFLDLNGHELDLAASITSASGSITIRNGSVKSSASGPKVQGSRTVFESISFSGDGIVSLVLENGSLAFIGCQGLPSLAGAESSTKTSPSVCGGSHGFATVDQLKVTDRNSRTGGQRLVDLQNFINDHVLAVISNAGAEGTGWLNALRRARLDRWVNLSDAKIERIETGESTQFEYGVTFPEFQPITPPTLRRLGVSAGIELTIDGRFNTTNMIRIVATKDSDGSSIYYIDLTPLTDAQWQYFYVDFIHTLYGNIPTTGTDKRANIKVWACDSNSVVTDVLTSATAYIMVDDTSTRMLIVNGVGVVPAGRTLLFDIAIMNATAYRKPFAR